MIVFIVSSVQHDCTTLGYLSSIVEFIDATMATSRITNLIYIIFLNCASPQNVTLTNSIIGLLKVAHIVFKKMFSQVEIKYVVTSMGQNLQIFGEAPVFQVSCLKA